MKNALLTSTALLSILICNGNSAQAQQAVIIPTGTPIHVRTIDPIDVNSTQPGARFRGSLADPVKSMNGAILIPRGAPVQMSVVNVRRSGRLKGRDRIAMKVDSISFNGRSYPVASSVAESRGHREGRRTLTGTGIGAGAGALIGGLAGGGAGLAVGALVGGGGGTAVAAATKGPHLRIPPETVLSFQLQSPLRVR
jgi:hypothetical protein